MFCFALFCFIIDQLGLGWVGLSCVVLVVLFWLKEVGSNNKGARYVLELGTKYIKDGAGGCRK